jgi:hypothetical protein
MQIRDYLIRSATQYINPDNRIGYGIPNFDKAYELAELESLINELKKSGQEVMVFPNPINDGSSTKVWVLKNDAGTNFEYSITDFSGKTLWSITTKESKITLPMLNELPLANVILKVTAENLQYSTKIVR